MLDPAGLGVILPDFTVGAPNNSAAAVDYEHRGAGCALIDREYSVSHFDGILFRIARPDNCSKSASLPPYAGEYMITRLGGPKPF